MSYSWNKDMSIDDQWQSWQDNTDLSKIPNIDTEHKIPACHALTPILTCV